MRHIIWLLGLLFESIMLIKLQLLLIENMELLLYCVPQQTMWSQGKECSVLRIPVCLCLSEHKHSRHKYSRLCVCCKRLNHWIQLWQDDFHSMRDAKSRYLTNLS